MFFSEPYIFKFWDDDAEKTGRSGANFPLIRYADVLLLCAEAKSMIDEAALPMPLLSMRIIRYTTGHSGGAQTGKLNNR